MSFVQSGTSNPGWHLMSTMDPSHARRSHRRIPGQRESQTDEEADGDDQAHSFDGGHLSRWPLGVQFAVIGCRCDEGCLLFFPCVEESGL